MTYPTKRLGHVASIKTSNVDKKSYDGEVAVRLCNYTDVYKNDTITADMDFMAATATHDQVSKFGLTVGDTVITKDSETADDIGIPAYVGESAHDLVCGYHLAIARPTGGAADPRFLYWCLASPEAAQQWSVLASGVTRVGLRQADIGKLEIPVPPLQTQREIAAVLDYETTRIDALIAKQVGLIELLAEKRQAIVTHAVTKGIDPTTPTKPSGVHWLGDIPAHWSLRRLKNCSRIKRGRFMHRPRNAPHLYDGEYPFIQTGSIARTRGKYVTEYMQTLSEAGMETSAMMPKGTLVMAIAANIGDVAILSFDSCAPDSVLGFQPTSQANTDFLYYALTAKREELTSEAPVTSQGNLNVVRVGSVTVPLPPVEEQVQIVKTLDDRLAHMSHTAAKASAMKRLLLERRSALISAAVTGKIDVREGVA